MKTLLSILSMILLASCSGNGKYSLEVADGYPTEDVWLVGLDRGQYWNDGIDASKLHRITGVAIIQDKQWRKDNSGKYDMVDIPHLIAEGSDGRERHIPFSDDMKIGGVYEFDNLIIPQTYKTYPVHLMAHFYKEVPYKGKVYKGNSLPKSYTETSETMKMGKVPVLDYGKYAANGNEGPILYILHLFYSEEKKGFQVTFSDQFGVGRTRVFPVVTILTEDIRQHDIVEVCRKGKTIIFKKAPKWELETGEL